MERWTKEEVIFLKRFYEKKGPKFCVKLFGRSEHSIKMKASRLKLRAPQGNLPNSDSYYKFIQNSNYEPLEDYINSFTKILHKHKLCGYEWAVSPNNLRKIKDCPNCCSKGSFTNKITHLYLLYIPEINLYKIGITNNLIVRLKSFGLQTILLHSKEFETGHLAYIAEQKLKDKLKPYLFNSGKLNSGNTETFVWPNLNVMKLNILETL